MKPNCMNKYLLARLLLRLFRGIAPDEKGDRFIKILFFLDVFVLLRV